MPTLHSRRSVLGTLAGGGLFLLGSSTPAAAFISRKPVASVDLSRLPSDWAARQGGLLQDYANYLAGLRLERITPLQVIKAHVKRRGNVWNTLPPKSMWKHMGPTLKVVDRLAGELGTPVRDIVSAYRSPAYNARCPGASRGSYHQANVAVDVKFATRPSTVSAVARRLRSRGYFKGGVGRYSTFTHIDTRGQNADW